MGEVIESAVNTDIPDAVVGFRKHSSRLDNSEFIHKTGKGPSGGFLEIPAKGRHCHICQVGDFLKWNGSGKVMIDMFIYLLDPVTVLDGCFECKPIHIEQCIILLQR